MRTLSTELVVRCVVVCLLPVLGVTLAVGCGNKPENQCPDAPCQVGTAYCDSDGNVRQCVEGGDGCGVPSEPTGCSGSTMCYAGSCSEGPMVSPPSEPRTFPSLFDRGIGDFQADHAPLIIPFEAFNAALQGRHFSRASDETLEHATRVNAQANDVITTGAFGEYQEAETFEGDLFLVAINPQFAPSDIAESGFEGITYQTDGTRYVEFDDYFVAAVELSGKTPWVGRSAAFIADEVGPIRHGPSDMTNVGAATLTGNGIGVPSHSCCPGSQPEKSCKHGPGGAGPVGCQDPGNCPSMSVPHTTSNASQQPFRVGALADTLDDEMGPQTMLRGDGQAAIELYAFGDRSGYGPPGGPGGVTGGGTGGATGAGTGGPGGGGVGGGGGGGGGGIGTNPVVCDQCGSMLCRSGQEGGGVPSKSGAQNPCGMGSVNPTCKVISGSPDAIPAECGGYCEACHRGNVPGMCGRGPGRSGGAFIGVGGGQAPPDECGGDVPAWCQSASPVGPGNSPCACDSSCQNARQQFMYRQACLADGNSPGDCFLGGAGTACQTISRGQDYNIERCISCNEEGVCEESTHRKGTGSRVGTPLNQVCCGADGADSSSEDSSGGNSSSSGNTSSSQESKDDTSEQQSQNNDPQENDSTDTSQPPDERTVDQDVGQEKEGKSANPSRDGDSFRDKSEEIAGGEQKKSNERSDDRSAPEVAKEDSTGVDSEGSEPLQEGGDPVALLDGSFNVHHTDLHFPGPTRPLAFQRRYASRSEDRTILGSNWTHNFDVRIEPVRGDSAPGWVPTYCKEWAPEATCVFMHTAWGSRRLFIRDPSTHAYVPQAGSTDTVRFLGDKGWMLRKADGRKLHFNAQGYLDSDRDRFGNGFQVEHEPTPLFLLYRRYCYNPKDNAFLQDDGFDLDRRICKILGYNFGERKRPRMVRAGWLNVRRADSLERSEITLPPFSCGGDDNQVGARPFETSLWDNTPADFCDKVAAARSHLRHLLATGALPEALTGDRKLRPTRVVDDIGRELIFSYYDTQSHCPKNKGGGRIYSRLCRLGAAKGPDGEAYKAGLLKSVAGPAGTRVRFDYDTPAGDYPSRLNEVLLTDVDRVDQTPSGHPDIEKAKDWSIDYDYQWPDFAGQPPWNAHADKVRRRFMNFFDLSVGCTARTQPDSSGVCSMGGPGLIEYTPYPGNPCFMAALRQHDYISNVADNLVTVTRNGSTIESESRYEIDPWDEEFDRVIAQRYGDESSTPAEQPDTQPEPGDADESTVDWETSAPDYDLDYVEAGPQTTCSAARGSNDATTGFLPQAIRQRYPLEDLDTDAKLEPDLDGESCPPDDFLGDKTAGRCSWTDEGMHSRYAHTVSEDNDLCSTDDIKKGSMLLPGDKRRWSYFDSTPETFGQGGQRRLQRSRLGCDQLASFQMANPAHNGNLSRLIKESSGDYLWKWLDDSRGQIADNMFRICAWTKLTDRDNRTRYYGLNYRGQMLVEATRKTDGSGYWFREMVYNADGNVIERRNPVFRANGGSADAWKPGDGRVAYEFESIEPDDENGWGGWRPLFWSRRDNLRRKVSYPDGPVHATTWDPDANESGEFRQRQLQGRVWTYRYGPFFNQQRSVTTGTLQNPDIHKIYYDLDYQELTAGSEAVDEMLDRLEFFGAEWLEGDGGMRRVNAIRDQQLRLHFYGSDLNGDGTNGFDHHTGSPINAIKGLTVRITLEHVDSGEKVHYQLDHAPNGRTNYIGLPGDGAIFFEYYSNDPMAGDADKFGTPSAGLSNATSSENKGFLARVTRRRYDADTKLPTEPSGGGCADLTGPYRYLVDGCPDGADQALDDLGLPADVRSAIIDSGQADSPQRWTNTLRTYNVTGHTNSLWTDGRTTRYVRETDGRITEKTDAMGNVTSVERRPEGWPVEVVTRDADGNLMGKVLREYDQNGNVLAACRVLEASQASACDFVSAPGDVAFDRPRPDDDAAFQLTTYRYTGEEQLAKMRDAGGLTTTFDYDGRGLLAERRRKHPSNSGKDRRVLLERNEEGQVTWVMPGTSATRQAQGTLNTHFRYDGFGRLVTRVDPRKTSWQFAYDALGRRTGVRVSQATYAQSLQPANFDIRTYHGPLGRTVERQFHGDRNQTIDFDPAGRPYRIETEGEGVTWMTRDASGQPIWVRYPNGIDRLRTWDSAGRRETRATIRSFTGPARHETRVRLTTAAVLDFDKNMDVVDRTRIGADGETLHVDFRRDGIGRLLRRSVRRSKGASSLLGQTRYTRNLAGWPTRKQMAKTTGANTFDTVDRTYDGRGLKRTETDAAGEKTTYRYNVFGQKTAKILPQDTPSSPHVTLGYDGYGRVDWRSRKSQPQRIRLDLQYQQWMRPSRIERTDQNSGPVTVAEWSYDKFGRTTSSVDYNPALEGVSGLNDRTEHVRREFEYDDFGRLTKQRTRTFSQSWNNYDVDSFWVPTVSGGRRRVVKYPSGAQWHRNFDAGGRLRSIERLGSGPSAETDFHWQGDIYKGRDQVTAPGADPVREYVDLDGFGRATERRYTALDLSANGMPTNASWADTYCRGSYNPATCSDPLARFETKRDRLGRLRSLHWHHGHPTGSNNEAGPVRGRPWRGYLYNAQSHLTGVWEGGPRGPDVDDSRLASQKADNRTIDAIGQAHNAGTTQLFEADKWLWKRASRVGDLEAIERQSDGKTRWRHSGQRNPGHQLDTVEVDGQTHQILHDDFGQVVSGAGHRYSYDERGRLSAVHDDNGQLVEAYAYDASGRLTQVYTSNRFLTPKTLVWDSDNIVAAYRSGSVLWEAAWGAKPDQLVEWRQPRLGRNVVPIADHRDNTTAVWDTNRDRVTDLYSYSARGRLTLRSADGQVTCREEGSGEACDAKGILPFLFQGQWRSKRTGVVYMRNRWYRPKLGQFLSPDPVGLAGGNHNLYGFGSFDPINGSDRWGLFPPRAVDTQGGNSAVPVETNQEWYGNATRGERWVTQDGTVIRENSQIKNMGSKDIIAIDGGEPVESTVTQDYAVIRKKIRLTYAPEDSSSTDFPTEWVISETWIQFSGNPKTRERERRTARGIQLGVGLGQPGGIVGDDVSPDGGRSTPNAAKPIHPKRGKGLEDQAKAIGNGIGKTPIISSSSPDNPNGGNDQMEESSSNSSKPRQTGDDDSGTSSATGLRQPLPFMNSAGGTGANSGGSNSTNDSSGGGAKSNPNDPNQGNSGGSNSGTTPKP